MVSFMPNVISRKAMTFYFITLTVVSLVFMNYILPFYFILFGIVEVCSFFYFSNLLTKKWQILHPKMFVRKLFFTSMIIRIIYAVFTYF